MFFLLKKYNSIFIALPLQKIFRVSKSPLLLTDLYLVSEPHIFNMMETCRISPCLQGIYGQVVQDHITL